MSVITISQHRPAGREPGGQPSGDSSVRVGPMVNIETVIRELGCDPGPIFERAGSRCQTYRDPDNRVGYLQAGRLLKECARSTGCPHFGLLVGGMSQPSHLGVTGFLVRTASNTRNALIAFVDNLDLQDEGGTLALDFDQQYTQMSFHVHQVGTEALEQVYDMCAAIMCTTLRALCGKECNAVRVYLPRNKPENTLPYRQFFQTVILFDSPSCAIDIHNHCLEQKPPTADELLFRHLEREARLQHRLTRHGLKEQLPPVIQQGLLLDRYSAGEIANALGLQERTFHRRLRAAGTSFREELDRVRESVSTQLLRDTQLPVCEIAQTLGYADSSGFIRAFQRWTGSSPSRWRRDARHNGRARTF